MDAATNRERRKQVRVRLRGDLIVTPQRYEGRRHFVVKDPVGLRYYRFKEQEHFLFARLDGQHTLDEVQQDFEKRFRPSRLTLEEVESFVQQLVNAGLAHPASAEPGRQLMERWRQNRRRGVLGALGNVLAIQVPLFDPDRLLGRMLPALRWLFTAWFGVVSAGVMVAALLLVATHFEAFRDKLPEAHEFFSWTTLLHLWLALGLVKVIHEFGHGLSCKAFGGEVHEMGAMFLCFAPSLYCNVTDSWRLPSKWQRMLIGFAGIYVELMIAALATFLWWHSTAATFAHQLSLSLIVVCSVNTVLFNGNPLMRYDGYYVLSDWLEVPNLRERAMRLWQRLLLQRCLGVAVTPEPYLALWRRTLLLGYGVASTVYRWMVTFGVLWMLSMFLRPYKLGAIGGLLALVTAAMMLGAPLVRFAQRIYQAGRLPPMKESRLVLSAMVVGTFVVAFCTVPLPLSRVRQIGLVEVRPDALDQVFVQVPGTLQRLYVRDGQRVDKGDLLAEFHSLELENQKAEALADHEIREVQLQGLRELTGVTSDPQERSRIDANRLKLAGERQRSAQQVEVYDKLLRRLQVRAPRAGVVMGLPPCDEIGKFWDKDGATPLCGIGDPARLWALVPLGPGDYRLVKDDLEEARRRHDELVVRVRSRGRPGPTWRGAVVQLPESEAKEVPLALTQRGGGPLAVKPGGSPRAGVPQSQQYLVAVALRDPDAAVYPGTMAQVAIQCRWRTGAWWLWRTVATTFDLGLAY